MTINQLIYFQTVAKLLNYHKAAEKLYISQPSLSRAIASLEEEFGIKLFKKDGRGIALTKSGRLFLEYVNLIIKDYNIAKMKMKNMSESGGKIDIGYVFPLAGHYIPSNVREFLDTEGNENITFSFYQNHSPYITEKVKSGEIDVGFGGYTEGEDELEYYPLYTQNMVMITPKEHPLNNRKSVSIKELENYPIIGYDKKSWLGIYTSKLYKNLDMYPDITVECPDEFSIMSLVSYNFGIAIVPYLEIIDRNLVNIIPFSDVNLLYEIHMFWVKGRYQIPAVEKFIDYMKRKRVEPQEV